jgi:hypothetical protein
MGRETGNDCLSQRAMGRQTPRIAARWTRGRGTNAARFSKSSSGAVRRRSVQGIHEISVGILPTPLNRDGAFSRRAQQVFQRLTPRGWNLRVGVPENAVDPGTTRFRACRALSWQRYLGGSPRASTRPTSRRLKCCSKNGNVDIAVVSPSEPEMCRRGFCMLKEERHREMTCKEMRPC